MLCGSSQSLDGMDQGFFYMDWFTDYRAFFFFFLNKYYNLKQVGTAYKPPTVHKFCRSE